MKYFLRLSRHSDPNREAVIRKTFGNNITIITEDLKYGISPVSSIRDFIDGLRDKVSDADPEAMVIAIEATGREEELFLVIRHYGRVIPIVRPVFRRGPDNRIVVIGKDENGRDIFDIERYEALSIEERPTIIGTPISETP